LLILGRSLGLLYQLFSFQGLENCDMRRITALFSGLGVLAYKSVRSVHLASNALFSSHLTIFMKVRRMNLLNAFKKP